MHDISRTILENKLGMLQSMIYRDIQPIGNWETRTVLFTEPLKYEPLSDWTPIEVGDH